MKSKNLASFANKMDEANFLRVAEEKCLITVYDLFSEIVTNVINGTCPLRRSNTSRYFPNKPWITKAILVSMKQKNQFYINYLKGLSENNLIKFKTFQNSLNSVEQKDQKLHF